MSKLALVFWYSIIFKETGVYSRNVLSSDTGDYLQPDSKADLKETVQFTGNKLTLDDTTRLIEQSNTTNHYKLSRLAIQNVHFTVWGRNLELTCFSHQACPRIRKWTDNKIGFKTPCFDFELTQNSTAAANGLFFFTTGSE